MIDSKRSAWMRESSSVLSEPVRIRQSASVRDVSFDPKALGRLFNETGR